jgi:uncharacterized repeat protein (TIGR03806 family)
MKNDYARLGVWLLVVYWAPGTIVGDDGPPGLTVRPPNPTCVLPDPPTGSGVVELSLPYPNLGASLFALTLVHEPGDDSTWYYNEKAGRIRAFDNNPNVNSRRTFLDLTDRVITDIEGGLLGFAFHPDWVNNREVYVTYTTREDPQDVGLTLHLSRFHSDDGGQTLAISTEEVLFSLYNNTMYHFGSRLMFGPFDGYLYCGMGEFNKHSNAQDTNVLQGSFLRIDVDGTSAFGPYGIPPDNPFATGGGRPEIWAYGLRNPWGYGFDSLTGDLWCGDVGGTTREEINRIENGNNYGWAVAEGDVCGPQGTGAMCTDPALTPPIVAFGRDVARCIIGGVVYRGSAIPELQGAYIYGDLTFQAIYALRFDSQGNPASELLVTAPGSIRTITEDADHELYIVSGPEFLKLIPASGGNPGQLDFPRLLSEVPCVDPLAPADPIAGMIPYEINVPFWSDNAFKERWFAIPDGETIEILPNGDLVFPIGTVFLKSFFLNNHIVESRLLVRHNSGSWAGYTYEWNASETDATLVEAGKTVTVEGQPWRFPGRGECLACHTAAAGFVLGAELMQLNRDMTYPSTGITANQLQTLEHIGMFDSALPGSPSSLPALPETDDLSQPLEDRARAYLHSNCANCHRPGTSIASHFDVRFDTALADTNLYNVVPSGGDLGIPGALLLTPGEPDLSILSVRLHSTDTTRMPPLGNFEDVAGSTLIDEWILNLPGGVLEPDPYQQDSAGLLVMEAEHHSRDWASSIGETWQETSSPTGSRGLAMRVPDRKRYWKTNVESTAPELVFDFVAQVPGLHYLWFRSQCANSGSNSIHYGLGGSVLRKIDLAVSPGWVWSGGGATHVVDIPAPGIYFLSIWTRESQTGIDTVLLTPDATVLTPNETGPAESSRAP